MKLVKLSDIFTIQYGVNLELNKLEQITSNKGIPFVSRTENHNGISAYVKKIDNTKPNPKNTISVAGGGSVLSTFYQTQDYYSGRDLYVLIPQQEMKKEEMLLYCSFIRANKYRYSYGRQANKTLSDIEVPSLDDAEKLIPKLNIKEPSKKPYHYKSVSLCDRKWNWFKCNELFEIKGTKSLTKSQAKEYGTGYYAYICTSSVNNGIEGFYDIKTEKGNVLTIDSATVGSCFYQNKSFSASDHVEKLIPKFSMNEYTAMFFCSLFSLEKYRYSYGRKFAQMRIKETNIKLPITIDGKPDWQFMEYYIKSLPYSSNLKEDKEQSIADKQVFESLISKASTPV